MQNARITMLTTMHCGMATFGHGDDMVTCCFAQMPKFQCHACITYTDLTFHMAGLHCAVAHQVGSSYLHANSTQCSHCSDLEHEAAGLHYSFRKAPRPSLKKAKGPAYTKVDGVTNQLYCRLLPCSGHTTTSWQAHGPPPA